MATTVLRAAVVAGLCLSGRGALAIDLAFTDVTALTGINAAHAPSALMETGPIIFGLLCGGGVCGDFNNDGFTDVFVVVGGKHADALYLNNGDGTFTDHAPSWGVAVKHMGLAAAVGDYDGDGWLDIFVSSAGLNGTVPAAGKHRLYRNTGANGFIEIAASAGVQKTSPTIPDGTGATFGDYDLDGDLDLYVAGWVGPSSGNRLFRNNDDGTFSDVSAAAGLPTLGIRGFSPRFADMDGDRFPELLIAADFGTSRYYRNNGNGTFTNLTTAAGVGLDDNGMGSTVGDYDNDGRLDWYVTSITSLTQIPNVPGTGNMLYRAVGTHAFAEVSGATGVSQGGWGWGTTFADFNHDGWLDLVATNGWKIYAKFVNDPTRLWLNLKDGTFAEAAVASGLIHTLDSRGLMTLDLENDGDDDLVIFTNHGSPRVFRNNTAGTPSANWLRLRFDTSGGRRLAPQGVGTRVIVTTEALTQIRRLDTGTNYQSQNELSVFVGLGNAVSAELRVEWADGTVTLLHAVPANQRVLVISGERSDLNQDGRVDGEDLGLVLESWGPCEPDDARDLTASGSIDGDDVVVLLGNWL